MMKSLAEELQIRERWMLGPVSEQTLRLGVKENSDVGFGFRHGQIRVSPTSSTLFSNEEGPLPNNCGVPFATALSRQSGVLLSLILRHGGSLSDRKDDVLVV